MYKSLFNAMFLAAVVAFAPRLSNESLPGLNVEISAPTAQQQLEAVDTKFNLPQLEKQDIDQNITSLPQSIINNTQAAKQCILDSNFTLNAQGFDHVYSSDYHRYFKVEKKDFGLHLEERFGNSLFTIKRNNVKFADWNRNALTNKTVDDELYEKLSDFLIDGWSILETENAEPCDGCNLVRCYGCNYSEPENSVCVSWQLTSSGTATITFRLFWALAIAIIL